MGKGIPSPFGFNGFPHQHNLPPEITAKIDVVIKKMMTKVEPDLQEISKILHDSGVQGDISFNMVGGQSPDAMLSELFGAPVRTMPSGGFAIPMSSAPSDELVEGIKKILDIHFGNDVQQILGMVYDPNRSVAQDIAKILEAARKRDQESVARELEGLATKIRSK